MKALITAAVLFAAAAPVSGQQWTTDEQSLLDQMEQCWDAWMAAQDMGGVDAFFDSCPTADDASMWWTEWGAPQSNDRIRREWEYIAAADLGWIAIQPVAVRIWDDVGMVQFYGYWKAQTGDGPVTTEYKRTEIFRRIDGQWVFVGGQGTPGSAADAEPYRGGND